MKGYVFRLKRALASSLLKKKKKPQFTIYKPTLSMYPFYNSHNILFLNFHITPNTIHFLFISLTLSLSLSLSLHHNIAADNSHNPLPQPQPQPSPPPNITYTYLYPYQKLQPSYLQPTTTATTITTPN